LVGVAWVGTLVVAAIVTGSTPSSSASDTELLSWVSTHTSTARAIGWITLVSVVVGLCFFGVLRSYLSRDRRAAGLASLSFGGAVLFGTGLLMELGPYYAAAERIKHVTVSAVEPIKVIVELGQLVQDAGVAVVCLAAGVAVLRTHVLPTWLGWAAVAVGVAALVPVIDPVGALAFVVWTLATSITMYLRWAPQPELTAQVA
jgi:hypothetical protein